MALKAAVVAATVFSALLAVGCGYTLWFVDRPGGWVELFGSSTFILMMACFFFSFGCLLVDRKYVKKSAVKVMVSSENKKFVSPEAQGFRTFAAGSKLMTESGDETKFGQSFIVYPPECSSDASGEPQTQEERYFENV